MAKQARSVESEISDRQAQKFVKDILEHFGNIDTARGVYMNKARREREAMGTIYETMAARGISQKASKTNIKIVRAMGKIRGWLAELETEDRRMAQRLAKAQADKHQLMLFGELPKLPKPERPTIADAKPKPRKGSGLTGEDLNVIEFREGA